MQQRIGFDRHPQAGAEDGMVVGNYEANFPLHHVSKNQYFGVRIATLIVTPLPAADSSVYLPPSICTRSAIPVNPMPLCGELVAGLNPLPLSRQVSCTASPFRLIESQAFVAALCLTTLLTHSWTTR
jgi:hypothetical protein